MFFRSKCPLNTHDKTWTEYRMQWLANVFGIERLTSAEIVLPTAEFFSQDFTGTTAQIDHYGGVLSRHMGIRDPLQYEVGEASLVGAPARLVQDQRTILIADSELSNPVSLISAITHELSRYLLLSEGHLDPDDRDSESIVDLLPVFCGLGVFASSATVHKQNARLPGGHLSTKIIGYALALFAWTRNEQADWTEHLRVDAIDILQRGLKYLAKANDCVFEPNASPDQQRWSVSKALDRTTAKSPSLRLAALWYLKEAGDYSRAVCTAVQRCLRDGDVAVRRAASLMSSRLVNADGNLQDDLLDAIRDSDATVRACAAQAIGAHRLSGPDVELGLEPLLGDPDRAVLLSTACAFAALGVKDHAVIERLGKRLKTEMVACRYDFAKQLAVPIGVMYGDLDGFAKSFFAHDPELYEQAQTVIDELRAEHSETEAA